MLAGDVRANVLPVYETTAIHVRMAVEWMLGDREEAGQAASVADSRVASSGLLIMSAAGIANASTV